MIRSRENRFTTKPIMSFNSFEFAVFLGVALLLHWYVFGKSVQSQNAFLLIAGWFFYAAWDWRFLGLLISCCTISYVAGRLICREKSAGRKGRVAMVFGVSALLGFIVVFKYYDFFVKSFADVFLNGNADSLVLNLILPVGISFYVFQAIGYCLDVYRDKVPAEKNILTHFVFSSFFPQLLAGPIGRGNALIPQFTQRRAFNPELATDGLRQILWGLFKKMVVADNCAKIVDRLWNGGVEGFAEYNASALVLGAILYSFQIYGDFSGYSDMAIGTAKLFGIKLGDNFLFPYFSRNVGEFWRRWHISLNTWFRDFVYIPLGGSRAGTLVTFRNILVVFGLSGLWHGANWTFVFWGLFHGILFAPSIFMKNRKMKEKSRTVVPPSLKDFGAIFLTFSLVTIGWIFFRASKIEDAFFFIKRCFSLSLFQPPKISGTPFIFIGIMLLVEWIQRRESHGLSRILPIPRALMWCAYIVFIFFILLNDGAQENFIYFKF